MLNLTPEVNLDQAFKKAKCERTLSKEIILAAAESLTAKGSKISLRKIAKEAGCAPPSIYYYFDGKQEIFFALFQQLFVNDDVIDFVKMESHLKDNHNLFRAMFSSESTNIDINQYLTTDLAQNHAESIIGRLILSGGK